MNTPNAYFYWTFCACVRSVSWGRRALAIVVALVVATGAALGATAPPVPARVILRPLTPTEISAYGLPSTTQKSAGLNNTGVGQPCYLEIQVPTGAVVTNVAWNLNLRPAGSAAVLADSPLGPTVPIFEPNERLVYKVAERRLLVPDLVGAYMVTVRLGIEGSETPETVGVGVTAAHYVGAGQAGSTAPQCYVCHQAESAKWAATAHSTMLTGAIDGTRGTYRSSCIACHTVGFDKATTATNGGFDDIAALVGWTFPTNIQAGNWAAMPDELKTLSNIQCENCHGPGSEHRGREGTVSVNFGSGNCGQCHDAMTHHYRNQQWNNSLHAIATRSPTGAGREGCVKCHSGLGFVDTVKGKSTIRTAYEPINCSTCHDPHNAANPHQLRKTTDVTLVNGAVVSKGGLGKLCMNCHMSRRNAETYVQGTPSSSFGPHHGPQADMLAGTNAITYGLSIPRSGHLFATEDSCVTCHMHEMEDHAAPENAKVGGHTFKPAWDGGTPEDPSDDVHLVGACTECHGPIQSFDFGRADYNGDGVIEGVQTEVQHLLDRLADLLPPAGPGVTVTTNYSLAQKKAAYNYLFVLEDGSKGVHNTAYAVGILKASIADLATEGDRDQDTLPDTWEMAFFGDLTSQSAEADADGDGVINSRECVIGTNPGKEDSDDDGFNDNAELVAASDPNAAGSTPDLETRIYLAAEFEFPSQSGKTYQVQAISQLGNDLWSDVGPTITGTGGMVNVFISTRTTDKAFYRVKELP